MLFEIIAIIIFGIFFKIIFQKAYFSRFGGPNENPSGYLYFKLQALRSSAASKPRVNRKRKSPLTIETHTTVSDEDFDQNENVPVAVGNEVDCLSLNVPFDNEVPNQILQSDAENIPDQNVVLIEIIQAANEQPDKSVPVEITEPTDENCYSIRRNAILTSKSITEFFEMSPIMMADGGRLVKMFKILIKFDCSN